ncbi:solute carrier family 15 member 2 isoform X5 [Falco naumanni]|uniref:solute carrier family 15 member 2 isoform X5 n=1 Tax=Falco peregrinus TaxID=8954 RepID=UPI000FFBDF41|nr:solute carrier family 15 member 2 isoform X5 [Falco peregrinus]XP_027660476.1 solute carrier family 15 member 2 isoform X5 [Falco cherrug]XP_037253989.1 solute carrier family 15 member 2 isoform X5 [Falco rusticolus]XP_040460514.1 solute carrier family 15 member 2 isoform X5 [Falco naumanni]
MVGDKARGEMNAFQRNESKETLFTFVSAGDDPPKGDFAVQKKSPKLCGSNYPLSIAFIVVNEFCERFSYYGMRAVLTLYFLSFFHWDENLSTAVYHAFSALCYFTPVIGAIMADSWLGKYKTIIYLSIVYVVGHLIKSVGAIPSLGNQTVHVILSMVGLFLIALGTGGIKPCVSAFGGDQFEEEHTSERSKFFSIFYLSINAGSLISTFVTPVLRGDVKCFGEDCYALAFGVPAALMVLALVVFIAGSGLYRKTPPQGNVLLEVCKCICKQLIGEVKMVTRVLFLFIPLPMFWALFDQQGSRWTLQATKMNADFGIYVLQPDQMQFLNPLLILVFIPIFDLGLYPLINMCKFNFTPIRKMATGMILAGMAFGLAAVVEIKINETDMPRLVPEESLIRVLNLAKNPVQVIIQDRDLFQQPVEAFQKPAEYSKLILNGEQQSLRFTLQHQGLSLAFNYTVKEKSVYSLIVFEAEGSLSSRLITDLEAKPENGLAAVRFINGLSQDVNLTIDSKWFIAVQKNYSASEYSLLERDRYNNGKCITETGEFTLELGLLDFGASYTIVITNVSGGAVKIWKSEDIKANNVHMAWQLPQYLLISAGEVMFSITGLAFSYSQSPASMKSVLQAGWLLTVAVGNTLVLIVAQAAPMAQWAEFVLFTVLLFAVCAIFSIMGYFYVSVDPEDLEEKEEKRETSSRGNMISLVTQKTKL